MPESNLLFLWLAIVLGLAAVLGYLARLFRLPLLVAYLLVGVALSFLKVFDLSSFESLSFLPEIGVTFALLFVGMELDLKDIKHLGKPILLASLGQIILSLSAGFLISSAFGFPIVESFYLGIGLAFSSTVVVVKLLSEKKDLNSLYGKLSLGILLVEDLAAIILLMFISVGNSFLNLGLQSSLPLVTLLVKGFVLLGLSLFLSRYVLESLFRAVAKSAELLFLSALAWCFIFVAVSLFLGFSVAIGAFLAGVALANSSFHYEIQSKVKPLRDFFVTLFFVYLGSQVVFQDLWTVLSLTLVFIIYALIIKPLVFLTILGGLGFRKHTMFQVAVNLSQVSEFSLIIMVVGLQIGLVSQAALTAMAMTGVVSITFSSIMIAASRSIYPKVMTFVNFFERGKLIHLTDNRSEELVMENHVILIGAHRIGGEIIKFLDREKIPFLVLDFNPEIVRKLTAERIHALYGDLGDPDILEFLNLEQSKLIISTASNVDDNLMLLSELRRRKAGAVVFTRATTIVEAEDLYKAGADYVILPEIVSGDFISQVLKNHWPSMHFFRNRGDVELNKLSRNHLAFE